MIMSSGLIIFFGLLFLAVKLPLRITVRLLGRPLAFDLTVAVVAYILHWGTFSGVMAAAVAGMLASIATTIGRRAIGYVDRDGYHRGWIALDPAKVK